MPVYLASYAKIMLYYGEPTVLFTRYFLRQHLKINVDFTLWVLVLKKTAPLKKFYESILMAEKENLIQQIPF